MKFCQYQKKDHNSQLKGLKCLHIETRDGAQVPPLGPVLSGPMSFILSSGNGLSSLYTKDQVVVEGRLIKRFEHKRGLMLNE